MEMILGRGDVDDVPDGDDGVMPVTLMVDGACDVNGASEGRKVRVVGGVKQCLSSTFTSTPKPRPGRLGLSSVARALNRSSAYVDVHLNAQTSPSVLGALSWQTWPAP